MAAATRPIKRPMIGSFFTRRLLACLPAGRALCKSYYIRRGQGTGDRGQGTGDRGQGTGDRGQGTGDRGQGRGSTARSPPVILSPSSSLRTGSANLARRHDAPPLRSARLLAAR